MLSRYDVTLLDEPTNDLDFDGLEHLERLVLGLPGGLMVVSHDREFLARTVNAVLEIDEHTREASFLRRQLGFIYAGKSGVGTPQGRGMR